MNDSLQSSYSFAERLTSQLLKNVDEKKQVLWPSAARALLYPTALSSVQSRFEEFIKSAFPNDSFEQALALSAWMKIATEQQMMVYGLATNDKELGDLMTELLSSKDPISKIEGREDFMATVSPMKPVIASNYAAQRKFEKLLAHSMTPMIVPLAKPQLWKEALEWIATEAFEAEFLAEAAKVGVAPINLESWQAAVASRAEGINAALNSDVWKVMIEETNSTAENRKEHFILASAHHTALSFPEVVNRIGVSDSRVAAMLDFAAANAFVSNSLFSLEYLDRGASVALGATRDGDVSSVAWGYTESSLPEDVCSSRLGLAMHILSLSGAQMVFGSDETRSVNQILASGVPASTHWVWNAVSPLFAKTWKAFDVANTPMTWIEELKGAALSKNTTQVALLRNKLVKAISNDLRSFISRVAEAHSAIKTDLVTKEVDKAFDKLTRWQYDIICHDDDVQLQSSSDAKTFARNTTVSFRTTRPVGAAILPSGAISQFEEAMLVRDMYQGGRVVGFDSIKVVEGLAAEMLKPFACTHSELSLQTDPVGRFVHALGQLQNGSLPVEGVLEELSFFDIFPAAQRSARSDFAVQVVRDVSRPVVVDVASQAVRLEAKCISVAGSGLTWGIMKSQHDLSVNRVSQSFAAVMPHVIERILKAASLQRPTIKKPEAISITVCAESSSYAKRIAIEASAFEPLTLDLPLICTLSSSVVVPESLQQLIKGLAFDQLRRFDVSIHKQAKASFDAIAASTAAFIKESTSKETATVLKSLFSKTLSEKEYAFLHDPYKRSSLKASLNVLADMLATVKASPVLSYYLAVSVVKGL